MQYDNNFCKFHARNNSINCNCDEINLIWNFSERGFCHVYIAYFGVHIKWKIKFVLLFEATSWNDSYGK